MTERIDPRRSGRDLNSTEKSAPQSRKSLGDGFEQVLNRGSAPHGAGNGSETLDERAGLRSVLPAPNLEFATVPVVNSAQRAPASESAGRQELIQKLVQAIELELARGTNELSFEIETGELGLEKVHLTRTADQELAVVLRVDSKASTEVLKRFRAELVEGLRLHGLTVKSAEIVSVVAADRGTQGSDEGSSESERRHRRAARRAARGAGGDNETDAAAGLPPNGAVQDIEEVTE